MKQRLPMSTRPMMSQPFSTLAQGICVSALMLVSSPIEMQSQAPTRPVCSMQLRPTLAPMMRHIAGASGVPPNAPRPLTACRRETTHQRR